ncbi:MAG: NAD-dependent epimerase/dehydratase family protein [Kineosporiaceae bacterium]|nr:NAD-dependent epimerase/dehydratase family protein [Aeromicrobium sp.]
MANILVLGGTSWLGGEIAKAAVAREHHVTCLARGEAGNAPAATTFVQSDRDGPDPYAAVLDQRWDCVFDVSWQPRFVQGAVETLGHVASHWTYVSSVSAYADQRVGGDEDAALLEPLDADTADGDSYGEAKVACERIVESLRHTLIARAGLLGGPGDRSDRFGYWVSRFALAGDGPVLVPDAADQPTQAIDARDLAVWLVESAVAKTTGVFNAVGEQSTLGQMIDAAAEVADFTGDKVPANPDWLAGQDVQPWAGPRSLPLWVPGHDGMGSQNDARIIESGISRRPMTELLADSLDYERSLGLDRERRAGLTRAEELALIGQLRHDQMEP